MNEQMNEWTNERTNEYRDKENKVGESKKEDFRDLYCNDMWQSGNKINAERLLWNKKTDEKEI